MAAELPIVGGHEGPASSQRSTKASGTSTESGVYDAKSYVELLNTFSGHIAMEDWKRERLYREIRLHLGRRRDKAV